jgi:hypothetical protein
MNIIKFNKEVNALEIKDEARLQKNGLILIFVLNSLNAILNLLRLYKEDFNFMHGIWLFIGIITLINLIKMIDKDYSEALQLESIIGYSFKKNFFKTSSHLILHLKNNKKRVITISTKKQLKEIKTLLNELQITK